MRAMNRVVRWALVSAGAVSTIGTMALAQGRGAPPQDTLAPSQPAPKDLNPLLSPRKSEIRLVVTRYNSDRQLLTQNYAGTGQGGGGGGGGGGSGGGGRGARGGPGGGAAGDANTPPLPPVVVSPSRLSRLKRFDLSWQTAITTMPTAKLSAEARTDRDSLLATIRRNLAQVDADGSALADVNPLLPFASKTVGLLEARIQLKDINSEAAAGTLNTIDKEIKEVRSRLAAGLGGADGAFQASKEQALRAASAAETMRSNLTQWFGFYNGYDPMFTWWMPVPYKHVDSNLSGYVAYLRDTIAAANKPSTIKGASVTVTPAPVGKYAEVPNLAELMALPQDEFTDIVRLFLASTRGGRGGGGGRASAPGAGGGRDTTFYRDWLTALKTVDFDKLSRNAQVDYLYLKNVSERNISRFGVSLAENPPRKQDNSGIPGAARGRDGLIRDLSDELIPYSPEQLMALAEKEFAWCDKEMLKASRLMGFGDNWKAALEKTKNMRVPPGGQPAMIRDLIFEAIDYLRLHDLVTVPTIAAESQRMSMMSAQAQLASPFFLGGTLIQVSYPTDAMEFDARMQSMRGNNRPWSHATAFHEMIPGHNLVGYNAQRFGDYRANLGLSGPFFGEGWPLYWEMMMYDKGFHGTPEERVGALFWRMHRCARIIFSLKFHMGQWSPQEAVDFLISRVGHEPDNAKAEVVRSFQGNYGPLYQAAYLLGGLQIRGLRRELVDSKLMPEKAFHDELLRQGSMPVALLRLAMTKQKLNRDMNIEWKFYGELPDK